MKHVIVSFALLTGACLAAAPENWWNPAWSQRQVITIDAGSTGAAIQENVSDVTALVRLFDGNFNFMAATADGKDLRFTTADGKTVLPHTIERYDNLINEAFVWVKLPEVTAGESTTIHLYYGSAETAGATAPTDAFDDATVMFHHFGKMGATFEDSTRNANHAENPGVTSDGGIIGPGLRVLDVPLVIPASETLDFTAGQELTITTWVRPAALQDNAVVFSKSDGTSTLRLLLNQGVPLVQVVTPAGTVSSAPGEAAPAATWSHLGLVAAGNTITLYLNGEPYGTLDAAIPAISGPLVLGGATPPSDALANLNGELDAVSVSTAARPAAWMKFAAVNQGASEASSRALVLGTNESSAAAAGGHNEALEHIMLFGDIAQDMMFDGWIAVGVCVLMIIFGWTVAVQKFAYLNSIEKGTAEFVKQWKNLSTDLTAIDHDDEASVKSLGGNADPEKIRLVEKSPLFQIYSIGSEEIRNRLARDKARTKGLSGRSIQAIRAALDTGLVRAQQKLTSGLIFLTVSIAGGPYVGLLGTVVGVMITFAIISKSGEVDVNSIAPGIASALLATVAGLIVAIPALFIYSYLNGRIKNVIAEMKVFIDEFVARMAEFYPPEGEISPYAPTPIPDVPAQNPNPSFSDHVPAPGATS